MFYSYAGEVYAADSMDMCDYAREYGTPLYAYPMPSSQVNLDSSSISTEEKTVEQHRAEFEEWHKEYVRFGTPSEDAYHVDDEGYYLDIGFCRARGKNEVYFCRRHVKGAEQMIENAS